MPNMHKTLFFIFLTAFIFLSIGIFPAYAVIPQVWSIMQSMMSFLPQIVVFLIFSISLIFKFDTWKNLLGKLRAALSNRIVLGTVIVVIVGIGISAYIFLIVGVQKDSTSVVNENISKYSWPALGGNAARTGNIDEKNGPQIDEEFWSFREMLDRQPFASSAAVASGYVYVGNNNSYLYCFDAQTGKVIWKFETQYEVFSSPAVALGKVYFGEGLHYTEEAKFYCVDAKTGELIWDFQTSSHTESSPVVADGKVSFGAGEDGVYCLDAIKGTKIWQFPGYHVDSSPMYSNDWLYFGSGYGSCKFFCINVQDGSLRWKIDLEYPSWGGPAVVNGKVYFGIGNGNFNLSDEENPYGGVRCLNAENGEEVWSYEAEDSVLTSVAVAEDRAYFGSRDGRMYCLDANTGKELWYHQTYAPIVSSPAVVDGNVYFGCNDHKLYCLDVSDGELLWAFDTGESDLITFDARILASPAVANGKVYIGSMNFYFYCIGEE